MEAITWSKMRIDKDEAAALGCKIKSMLGIKDNSPITGDQLRYMKNNWTRITGMDNHAWYRDRGKIVELHPKTHGFCTNWIVFKK